MLYCSFVSQFTTAVTASLFFFVPSLTRLHHTQDRLSILSIHTCAWKPPLKPAFLSELSEQTVGYCGADIKALCTEAALFSLRRQFPQIYSSSNKLVIDVSKIYICASDFYSALKSIVPTAQRSDVSFARTLSEQMYPLLGGDLQDVLTLCCFTFPPSWKCVAKAKDSLTKLQQREERKRRETQQIVKEIKESSQSRNGSGTDSGSNSMLAWSSGISSLQGQGGHVTTVGRRRSSSHRSTTCFPQSQLSKDQFLLPYASTQRSVALSEVFFDLTDNLCLHGSQLEGDILDRENSSEMEVSRSQSAEGASSGQLMQLTSHPHIPPLVHRPRLLIAGPPGERQML